MAEKQGRDFLDLHLVEASDLREMLERAKRIKFDFKKGERELPLAGRSMAMIFEKPSTRTRVSFELAMQQMGGYALNLTQSDSQLKRGETIHDTAKVLSRYVDILMMRTFNHETLQELAKFSSVPVVNGLTDFSHPCQVMADILTLEEHNGPIEGQTVAWIGDCNNVTQSWIHAAKQFKFRLHVAVPKELTPPANILNEQVTLFESPAEAVKEADCVTTDTWVSMGDGDANEKIPFLQPFQVNDALMAAAKPTAAFLHCLPAHRGWEVTDSVMDGPQSKVWDEAENRLHIQKTIILWCLGLL